MCQKCRFSDFFDALSAEFQESIDREEHGLKISVAGGTANSSGESLCKSCTHYRAIKDVNNKVYRECDRMDMRRFVLPEHVVECNTYINKSATTLQEMKQIAWEIKGDPKKKIGFEFVPPDKSKGGYERAGRFGDIDVSVVNDD